MSATELGETLKWLLALAWLLPLAGFAVEVFGGYWSTRVSKAAAYLAVGCIAGGFVCSCLAFYQWGTATGWAGLKPHHGGEHAAAHGEEAGHADEHGDEHADHAASVDEHATAEHLPADLAYSGTYYQLAAFGDPAQFEDSGKLVVGIDYYIDSLTLVMFMMVTLIATCIHVFAIGYMSDELTENHVDHEVHLSDGSHLHRPGRFYRFFSYMSLFCFSMLGLVLAGNIFQVFVFWELVGICSYLLIGFYVERHSASTAANKAFIMNRVGDFGFLIGLMILWTWCGTFRFDDHTVDLNVKNPEGAVVKTTVDQPGLFTLIRGTDGALDVDDESGDVIFRGADGHRIVETDSETGEEHPAGMPYMLLVAAGLGIFAGCVGKSAQFPLQTWLPDAMEGPTPVSALVHSATMVAAGVYLAGRFYPVFTPEVLLVISYVACITLFVAATIAVVATDIKRVLAYSTISQLGYMMLGIGVAGWAAGLFHLITHAFFKSLMFLASGSVIVGCHHEQEMPRMGGLRKKMPITAYTMLVGVIAICGLAIPGIAIFGYKIAFSGYHSKDAIVATAMAFSAINPAHKLLFLVPLITAGITAFYMFRLWFYTFAGQPRDQELYDHVHESPAVMTGPLVVLALFAAFCAVGGEQGKLFSMLATSEPQVPVYGPETAGLHIDGEAAAEPTGLKLPSHQLVAEEFHAPAGAMALMAAVSGTVLAYLLYCVRAIDPADIKRQFAGLHYFLVEKWHFDTLYDVMFVQPVHIVASWAAWIDRVVIDGFLHATSKLTVDASRLDRRFDEAIIDGLVNLVGDVTFAVGRSLRVLQTGFLRQYVMFIAVGVLLMFGLLFMLFPK